MRLIKNDEKIVITRPKMQCDAPLGKNIPAPLMNNHAFVMFVAPPGSGKTSTLCGLLTSIYKKVFQRIFVFMPHASAASLPDNHLFRKMDIVDELTGEGLHKVIEELKKASEDDEPSLIIIDDQVSMSKNIEVINELKYLILNRRHLRCSIWMAGQTLNATAALVFRKNASHVFTWRPGRKELIDIWSEFMNGMPKEMAEKIYKTYCVNAHDFLFITMSNNKIYNKDFDQILWDDDRIDDE